MANLPQNHEKTTCPNCGGMAEWDENSDIDCDDCGVIETELVESEPYVVEHRLDGEVIQTVDLEA